MPLAAIMTFVGSGSFVRPASVGAIQNGGSDS